MKGEKFAKKVHGEQTKHCLLKGRFAKSSYVAPGNACSKIGQDWSRGHDKGESRFSEFSDLSCLKRQVKYTVFFYFLSNGWASSVKNKCLEYFDFISFITF